MREKRGHLLLLSQNASKKRGILSAMKVSRTSLAWSEVAQRMMVGKFWDLLTGSDEFWIISRGFFANADDKITDLSARGDGFGASAEGFLQMQIIRSQTYRLEVMVSEHQAKSFANADDKITGLSARSDGFGASTEGLQMQKIR